MNQRPQKTVTSYRRFLKTLEEEFDSQFYYVRVPKKLLIDKALSGEQFRMWVLIASFMYTARQESFPSRERIAELLGIKHPSTVSRYTAELQKKGYLEKYTRGYKVFYEPYFSTNIDDSAFMEALEGVEEFRPSKKNRIRHATVTSESSLPSNSHTSNSREPNKEPGSDLSSDTNDTSNNKTKTPIELGLKSQTEPLNCLNK